MASSSSTYCSVFVSLAVLLSYLFVSASATKFIDGICQKLSTDKDFCYKTLNAYHPVTSATCELKAAEATIGLAISYANKYYAFVKKAATESPRLKKQLVGCLDAFKSIALSIKSSAMELPTDPETANYDAMVCHDEITRIRNLIGKNTDKVSKSVITVTSMMEKFINISVGATVAVGG